MGFLRQLFGTKKPPSPPLSDPKPKKRWGFARSRQEKTRHASQPHPGAYAADNFDANKHAIAVAAATAAVAEAALAAAQAAAEVVRLTNRGGGGGGGGRVRGSGRAPAGGTRRWAEIVAAVKIQSAFRGYLARRALRALKALVKLQAVVRGHIVRKQTADMFKRMQTLVRVQARARATRSNVSESLHFSCKTAPPHHPFPASPDKNELRLRAYSTKFDESSILKRCGSNSELRDVSEVDKARSGSNWLNHWMEENLWNNSRDVAIRSGDADDEKSDKILEVDTWKPRLNSQPSHRTSQSSQHYWSPGYNKQNSLPYDSPSKYSAKGHNPMPSVSSGEAASFSSFKYPVAVDESALRTAENSPQVYSTSSRPGSSSARRGGPFTPARSECSWGYFNGYSDHPNYMANTESFRAKVRSQSAPRQRLEFERYGQNKRSAQGSWDAETNSEKSYALQGEPKNKAYPISSSLNRNRSTKLR